MTRSRYDRRKRNVLRRCLNIASDGAEVMCGERIPDVGAESPKSPFADSGDHTDTQYDRLFS